jgi:hypothetical protein
MTAFFGLGLLLCGTVTAQVPTNRPARIRLLSSNAMAALPPVPDPVALPTNSPVVLFRELLAMNIAERNKCLADRSPENRKLILGKVREYLSMKPSERELRLKVTELRWYLWPLMKTSATNRAAALERIPAEDRKLVEDRLQEWDTLSASVQADLRTNEATLRYFTELTNSPQQKPAGLTNGISAARREALERGVKQLQAMPEEKRQELIARFYHFFDLTPQEKAKTLGTLSEPEQRQIEKTLRQFGQLPPAQRAQCVRSFEKFTSLSLAERQQFLKNAERWKLMSPDERQAWKDLVEKLAMQPLLPDSSPLPPMPQRTVPRLPHRMPAIATNGN